MSYRHKTSTQAPLAVDLDGTLIHSSLVWEGLCALLRQKPAMLFACAWWALRGRAYWKYRMAATVNLDVDSLPYNFDILGFLQLERSHGRRIYLATGANQRWAEQVAAHLGLFDGVIGSTFRFDNTGERKARCCVEMFGEREFDYLGRHEQSLQAMRAGRHVLSVGPVPKRAGFAPQTVFASRELSAFTFLRALRLKQWPKNLLLFVPLFVSLQWANVPAILASFAALAAFCLAASGCYLLNDLADLAADRGHVDKRHRPLASGRLPIPWVFAMSPSLLASAFALAAVLPRAFAAMLGLYVAGSLLYSFWLKRAAVVDVVLLAALSLLRVLAGAAATGIQISPWLLVVCVCSFLSMALLQRSVELARQAVAGTSPLAYEHEDAPLLSSLGVSTAALSALVLALYVFSDVASLQYHHPQWLWAACAALFCWMTRLWLVIFRAPVTTSLAWFVACDKSTYAAIGSIAASLWLAR